MLPIAVVLSIAFSPGQAIILDTPELDSSINVEKDKIIVQNTNENLSLLQKVKETSN